MSVCQSPSWHSLFRLSVEPGCYKSGFSLESLRHNLHHKVAMATTYCILHQLCKMNNELIGISTSSFNNIPESGSVAPLPPPPPFRNQMRNNSVVIPWIGWAWSLKCRQFTSIPSSLSFASLVDEEITTRGRREPWIEIAAHSVKRHLAERDKPLLKIMTRTTETPWEWHASPPTAATALFPRQLKGYRPQ